MHHGRDVIGGGGRIVLRPTGQNTLQRPPLTFACWQFLRPSKGGAGIILRPLSRYIGCRLVAQRASRQRRCNGGNTLGIFARPIGQDALQRIVASLTRRQSVGPVEGGFRILICPGRSDDLEGVVMPNWREKNSSTR